MTTSQLATIDIDQLVMGRPLPCPIYDTQGRLLLSAGASFTAEQKLRMRARGVVRAIVEAAQLDRISISIDDCKKLALCEQRLNDLVDQEFRAGRFQVKCHGPAIAERVVQHGKSHFSDSHQQAAKSHFSDGVSVVGAMVEEISRGTDPSADEVQEIADSTIDLLAQDMGGTLFLGSAENLSTTAEHSIRAATLAMGVAIEMGLDAENVQLVGTSCALADIGMTQVPTELREAPRRLTPGEFSVVQRHVIHTANFLEKMQDIPDLVKVIAYQSHERPDGSGYPRGQKAKTIHPFAMLINVVDAFVAMTAQRPHRPPIVPYAAVCHLLDLSRRGKVDCTAVRAMLNVLSLFPIGSLVTLSDGSVAQVLRTNGEEYMKPIVAEIQNSEGEVLNEDSEPKLIDLTDSELSIIQAIPNASRGEVNRSGSQAESASEYCLFSKS